MAYRAKILLDSLAPCGKRLTTFELTYPRLVHSEMLTHRLFCLDGETELYFDLPGGRGKPGRRLYRVTIRDLYEKWHLGIARPDWKRHEYDAVHLTPERTYRTRELAATLGVQRQTITRLCREESLPHRSEGKGKQAVFHVRGDDFIEWATNRSVSTYDAKPRIRKMALRCCNERTGEIVYTRVQDIFYSGVKPVYRVTFEDGKSITCSKDHQFLTESGWQTLEAAVDLSWSANGVLHWNPGAPRFAVNGKCAYTDPDWLLARRREGLSAREIAEIAGVTVDRVKYQFRKYRIGVQDLSPVTRRTRAVPWNKGKTYSNPKLKDRPGKPQPTGPASRLWKGGITPERKLIGVWTQKTAPDVHARNGFQCVIYGCGRDLRTHHIDPVYRNPQRARDLSNLTTLCERCHTRIHDRYLEELFLDEYTRGSVKGFWERHGDPRSHRPESTRPPGHVTVIRQWVRVSSVEYAGDRETYDVAVEGPWHNFVANGIVVHNSRNSSSSRAIPIQKMIRQVRQDPVIPVWWGKQQKGMQAQQEITGWRRRLSEWLWCNSRYGAMAEAWLLWRMGMHKQVPNRLLEPWMWITVILSATEYENFFSLRCHPDAQPEIRKIADMMAERYYANIPTPRQAGEWHLPLTGFPGDEELDAETLRKVSVARCARVSYLTHDGRRDIQADLTLYDRLLSAGHMSPFEHVAQALNQALPSGNFSGWLQYRKTIPNEHRDVYEPGPVPVESLG